MTRGNVFLIEWDSDSAERTAAALRRQGWRVEVESENGGRAYRAIRTSVPDAVVLDLRRKPSHGREVGGALRELNATRAVPILCIEDADEAREATRAKIPDARFVLESDLLGSLDEVTRERVRLAKTSSKPSVERKPKPLPIGVRGR